MRLIRSYITTILVLVLCIGCAGNKEANVAGTYVSINPDLNDRLGIMYFRGHFHFLFTRANKDTLYLNDDNTFVHIKVYDTELERPGGIWKKGSDHVILQYSDTLINKNKSLKITNDKIYRIDKLVLCENNKVIRHLTLYKKQ
jgi:hypothetical protein